MEMSSFVNENRQMCVQGCFLCASLFMRIMLGSSLSGPLSFHVPGEAGARGSACPQPVLADLEVEALLTAMAVPAGPCSEGPVTGTRGLCSPLSCLRWGQGLSWGQWSRSVGELGTVSVQNRPLFLVCAAVASGPLPCRHWEAAEPAPGGILDAVFCITAVLEVGGGRLCSSLRRSRWQKAPWPRAALDRGAVECCLRGGCDRAGVLQQESMESGADLLLCTSGPQGSGERAPGAALPLWRKGDDLSLPGSRCLLQGDPALLHGQAMTLPLLFPPVKGSS